MLAFFLMAGIFLAEGAKAQVSVSVNVNIGSQPNWGPTGYDNVNYYYMPDIETNYTFIPTHEKTTIVATRSVLDQITQADTVKLQY